MVTTTTTRRQFLKGMGGVAVGVVVGSGMTGVLTSCSSEAEGIPTPIPPTQPPAATTTAVPDVP